MLVRVKTASEIAASLDEDGTLDGLPFMPEMVAFCGKTLRVRSSAHKTCDTVEGSGLRRLESAVHLEGAHCDGGAHAGCQSRCPIFWKDEWLVPASFTPDGPGRSDEAAENGRALSARAARSVRLHGRRPEQGSYSCQATEILQATSPLPIWSLRQFVDDIGSGNVAILDFLRALPVFVFNACQKFSRHFVPARLRIRGGAQYPFIIGRGRATRAEQLYLEPGEVVEVLSLPEILDTLDAKGRNRGLVFGQDMVPFCGQQAVVSHRVEVRLDERTGEPQRMKKPCVVLRGVTCPGRHHGFCPRGVDHYWREVWLRRVGDGT